MRDVARSYRGRKGSKFPALFQGVNQRRVGDWQDSPCARKAPLYGFKLRSCTGVRYLDQLRSPLSHASDSRSSSRSAAKTNTSPAVRARVSWCDRVRCVARAEDVGRRFEVLWDGVNSCYARSTAGFIVTAGDVCGAKRSVCRKQASKAASSLCDPKGSALPGDGMSLAAIRCAG